ncbi:MAG: cbb3-type cytochrome oxidase assembly protein CcoS [Deferribacteraceae bacterium]|jgi:cbb3-type cytochrome oxidase maturation protein|nr:cbb3-type cytochrome oxidase assembly protein CcoS [Deferribacteraceae bacterium]
MSSLYILIGVSLIVSAGVLALLIWANKREQFEDPEGPKYRILDDD